MFQTIFVSYHIFLQVMTTLVSAFLGKFNFTSVAGDYGSYGILFLLVYLMTMIFLILNLFICLINEYITMVKRDPRVIPRDHKVVTHFIETLKSLIGRIMGRNVMKEGKVLGQKYTGTVIFAVS